VCISDRFETVANDARANPLRQPQRLGAFGVDHRPVVRLLIGKDALFRRRVGVRVRMPIEMIGREVQQRRNPGMETIGGFELETAASTTCTVSLVDCSTCALSGSPMLPPTKTRLPDASSIRPTRVVVVDFPWSR
jgi:hypothetical protein